MTTTRRSAIARRLLGLVAFFICGLGAAQAASSFFALPEKVGTSLTNDEIRSGRTIRIEVKKRSLREVLQELQNRSGIRFELAGDLMEEKVDVAVEAPNWPEAVRRLLRGFSRLELYDEKEELRRVLVSKHGSRGEFPPVHAPQVMLVEASPGSRAADAIDPGTADTPPGVIVTGSPHPPPPSSSLDPAAGPPDTSTLPYQPGPEGP